MDPLLKQWNETYFAGQLSSEVLNILDELALSSQSNSVQGFIERYFKFMQQTYVPAIDFPDELARIMHSIPHFMSNTWVSTPPPITYAGRHTDIDDYVSYNQWRPLSPQGQFLDLGCGFPPRTTLDTADRLPAWQVIGADPIIPAYIVYDEHDNHATFDQTENILYFQSQG